MNRLHNNLLFLIILILSPFCMTAAHATTDIILDNNSPGTTSTGTWQPSSGANSFGSQSLYSREVGATYTYTMPISASGTYDVNLWWTTWPNRSTEVAIDITHRDGTDRVFINQQQNGGQWNTIGSWFFDTDVIVTIHSSSTNKSTNADALQLIAADSDATDPLDLILDNNQPGTTSTGTWQLSAGTNSYGTQSLYSREVGATYTYTMPISASGTYDVNLWWTTWPSRSTEVAIDITHRDGTDRVFINQQQNGGQWNNIGSWDFDSDIILTIHSSSTSKSTSADALQLIPVVPVELILDNNEPGTTSTGTWQPSSGANSFGAQSLYSREIRATYTFTQPISIAGVYDVHLWWTTWPNRSTEVAIDITHRDGTDRLYIDQTKNGGQWNKIGSWFFDSDAVVTIHSSSTNRSTSVDALQLISAAIINEKPSSPKLRLHFNSTIKTFHFHWSDVSSDTQEFQLLENPDGISGFNPVAVIAADSRHHDIVVSFPARVNARYILQACNTAGCSSSSEVTVNVPQLVTAVGYVKAFNAESGDSLGYSVALSGDGNTLAVGAPHKSGGRGTVYLFTRNGMAWRQQAYLEASNTEDEYLFGSSLALSANGNTLAAGVVINESNGDGGDGVYIFTRNDMAWSQQANIQVSTSVRNHSLFASSLALSADGKILALGAINESDSLEDEDSGTVYIYGFSIGDGGEPLWTQQASIKASNTEAFNYFGSSLALSANGTTLAIGTFSPLFGAESCLPGNLIDCSEGLEEPRLYDSVGESGAVYMFVRSGTTSSSWNQQAYIKPNPDLIVTDWFGYSVALSSDGNSLAVGAPREDSAATGIGGDQSNNSVEDSGAVYMFTRNDTAWNQQAYIKASNTNINDEFGGSVALSANGKTLAVGAVGERSAATGINGDQSDNSIIRSGAVYQFTRSDTTWNQQAYIKASNTSATAVPSTSLFFGHSFGNSVTLSDDGNVLAIGAPGESSNATGVGGNQNDNSAYRSGAVYLY